MSKITIDRHLHNPLGRTIGYIIVAAAPVLSCCFQYLSIYPEPNPLWLPLGIHAHYLPPVIGPIAYIPGRYVIGCYPGYRKKPHGTQTYRSWTLQSRASHHLVAKTIDINLFRYNDDRQRRVGGCCATLKGHAACIVVLYAHRRYLNNEPIGNTTSQILGFVGQYGLPGIEYASWSVDRLGYRMSIPIRPPAVGE